MGSRGASSGRSSGITKGMTASEEQNLHDLAMASLVWRDDSAGTNVTTEEERKQYRLEWKSGGVEFEKAQYDTLKTVAERNNIADEFKFDEVRAQVRTTDGRFRIMGDDYALARGNDARKWIVNEIDTASKEFYKPTIEQNRFSTPQQALAFVVDKRKKK